MELLNRFVELPPLVVDSVTALIVGALVFAINWIILRVPIFKFLSAYAQEWGLALAAAAILWFQNAVPDIYAAIAVHAVELILAIIAVVTGFRTFAKRRGLQGFL
jgi:hypothetical protein